MIGCEVCRLKENMKKSPIGYKLRSSPHICSDKTSSEKKSMTSSKRCVVEDVDDERRYDLFKILLLFLYLTIIIFIYLYISKCSWSKVINISIFVALLCRIYYHYRSFEDPHFSLASNFTNLLQLITCKWQPINLRASLKCSKKRIYHLLHECHQDFYLLSNRCKYRLVKASTFLLQTSRRILPDHYILLLISLFITIIYLSWTNFFYISLLFFTILSLPNFTFLSWCQ